MLALTLKRSELTNSRNLRCKTPLNFRVASGNVRVQTNYSLRVAKEKHNIFISYRGNTKFVLVTKGAKQITVYALLRKNIICLSVTGVIQSLLW